MGIAQLRNPPTRKEEIQTNLRSWKGTGKLGSIL